MEGKNNKNPCRINHIDVFLSVFLAICEVANNRSLHTSHRKDGEPLVMEINVLLGANIRHTPEALEAVLTIL